MPFYNFYKELTSPDYNATTDVYAPMFACDFINFLIVLFGYQSFGPAVSMTCFTFDTPDLCWFDCRNLCRMVTSFFLRWYCVEKIVLNSLPNDKILDKSEFKAFADGK